MSFSPSTASDSQEGLRLAPAILPNMCRELRIVRQDSVARLCEISDRATHRSALVSNPKNSHKISPWMLFTGA